MKKNYYHLWTKYEMKKVRKKGQKRCNRYGYIASFKNCPLEHSAKWSVIFLFNYSYSQYTVNCLDFINDFICDDFVRVDDCVSKLLFALVNKVSDVLI